jgi:hypothetical protein
MVEWGDIGSDFAVFTLLTSSCAHRGISIQTGRITRQSTRFTRFLAARY